MANFDTPIDRRGTHSVKWDSMSALYNVDAQNGLAMWVADMDFTAPDCVRAAVSKMNDLGVFGYYGEDASYRAAIIWWMKTRHGWDVQPDWIFTTHGLVNGTAMCLDAFTAPGDGVVVMSPVYHAFAKVVRASNRDLVECPLAMENGKYVLDIPAWDAQLQGHEKLLILCSPHNPGGRVWTADELRAIADFAIRHDLIIVSDEIHHDLVMPGHQHLPMATTCPDITDRLVMMTATTKTFNIAGSHSGNVIIADADLRARFGARMMALGLSPNSFGLHMAEAAYSTEGAAWVDELMVYIAENARIFDEGVNAIPGLQSMPLEATYLAWVDFSGTGMAASEFIDRVQSGAQIAANHGSSFGRGGDNFLRFNLGTQRANVLDAVARLQKAFADLQ